MDFIDLHIHSTASDGTVRPEDIPALAEPERYERVVLSLTDHDCVSGYAACRRAAEEYPNVTVLAGVEISTDYRGNSVHMLGYGIDPEDPALQEQLKALRNGRDIRNAKILEKLRGIGIAVPEETIHPEEGEAIGRPLIARWLVENGYAKDNADAFARYLGVRGSCYVDRMKYTPKESIRLIRDAGGKAVLAHPMQYKFLQRPELEEMIALLKSEGLEGIETYYTEFTEEETRYVERLADRFGLIRTGGSDFHGENKPTYTLGYGWGNLGATFGKIEYEKLL